jgi:hypothetical protein
MARPLRALDWVVIAALVILAAIVIYLLWWLIIALVIGWVSQYIFFDTF